VNAPQPRESPAFRHGEEVNANKVHRTALYTYRITGAVGTVCDEIYELEQRGFILLDAVTGRPGITDEGAAWLRQAPVAAKRLTTTAAFHPPEPAR
jgi:hypothetical protein